MIAGVGLGYPCVFARSFPVKIAAVNDNAADSRAVSADEFRSRMHHDIRPVLYRAHQIGRGEGAVHHQRDIVTVSDLRPLFDIAHV